MAPVENGRFEQRNTIRCRRYRVRFYTSPSSNALLKIFLPPNPSVWCAAIGTRRPEHFLYHHVEFVNVLQHFIVRKCSAGTRMRNY